MELFNLCIDRLHTILNHLKKRLQPPRYLRFTKFGTYTVLLTMGIGFGAMNTGNNLVYLIFGMMLGFITASGVISEISLRHIDVDWILPAEFYVQKSATIRLILRNLKEKFPSFAIQISIKIKDSTGSHFELTDARFLFIQPKSQKYRDIPFSPHKRGKYSIEEIKIETAFPFTFFRKYLTRSQKTEFIVYPKIDADFSDPIISSHTRQQNYSPLKGWSDSFWGMRDFVDGDHSRQISWKASAKQGKLIVTESEKETELKVTIGIISLERWKKLNEEELESAVSFAASYVQCKFIQGYAVGLVTENFILPPSTGRKNQSAIFDYLALFNPSDIHFSFLPNAMEFNNDSGPIKASISKPLMRHPKSDENEVDIFALWKQHV